MEFLLCFLPIFLILYGLTPNRYKNMTLLSASLVFYAFGEPKYLMLLCGSVVVNYYIGLWIGADTQNDNKKQKYRKILWIMAVIGNIMVLGFFKSGIAGNMLPLGISFYTFQILSYLIEVYRGNIPGEKNFVRFAAYVTMFPKLVSGPITEYSEVSDRLGHPGVTVDSVVNGLKIFTFGLAAKVLLADRAGLLWNEVMVTGIESISTPLAWLAAIAFSMEIYFDFYGYTLMAEGLGVMLGFTFPDNFCTPYMAVSVRDFYRRWHMTLGRWFKRYVYIPLGGSRKGELRTVMNLLAVWLLTSIWHGVTYNFLLWGMMLFLLIVVERQLSRLAVRYPVKQKSVEKGLHLLGHLYLWTVIPVSWVCFAIPDTEQLILYLCRMFGGRGQSAVFARDWQHALQNYSGLLLVCFVACTPLAEKMYHKWKDNVVLSILLAALFWVCVWRIGVEGNNPFLYLNF